LKAKLTVLITGCGSPAAPGVIQSLRSVKAHDFSIIGVDMDADNAGRGLVDLFFKGPKADDPDFIHTLLNLARAHQVDCILPLVTKELPAFAKHREAFNRIGTAVSVSDEKPLAYALNKGRLFHFLKDKGFRVPDFHVARTPSELKSALADLGYPKRAVCFKPTESDGSRGFRVLDQTKDRFDLLFHAKPTSVYMDEKDLYHLLKGRNKIPETVVMEYLPNEEYSVDLLMDRGKHLIAIPRLRQRVESGISVRSKIVKEDDVIDYAVEIAETLGLNGNIGIQIRRDDNGIPKILEINPRIQGTIVHCTAAGVNLPYLAVKLALGLPIQQEELKVHWGLSMVRYWKEVFFDEKGQPIDFQRNEST
jgi:carbamoyl-phosphate synthase large subunit